MAHISLSRRQLLRFAGFAAGAASLPASLRLAALLSADEATLFPGALAQLQVHGDAPANGWLRLTASDCSQTALSAPVVAAPGTVAQAVVPYPYEDLVEGEYTVRAQLCDAAGAVLASLELGHYRVRRFRFSA